MDPGSSIDISRFPAQQFFEIEEFPFQSIKMIEYLGHKGFALRIHR